MSGANCVHLFAQRGHGWHAPLGAPLPLGERILKWRSGRAKLGHEMSRERNFFPPPRSGGGGPPEGWWRAAEHPSCSTQIVYAAPLPPPCCAGWSPFPAFAGQDESLNPARG